MLYTINLRRLITSVLPLDFSPQKKGESDGHYHKRMSNNEDSINAALVKAREYGWQNWLKTQRMTEKGMCEYFTKETCSAMPITSLNVEYSHV